MSAIGFSPWHIGVVPLKTAPLKFRTTANLSGFARQCKECVIADTANIHEADNRDSNFDNRRKANKIRASRRGEHALDADGAHDQWTGGETALDKRGNSGGEQGQIHIRRGNDSMAHVLGRGRWPASARS